MRIAHKFKNQCKWDRCTFNALPIRLHLVHILMRIKCKHASSLLQLNQLSPRSRMPSLMHHSWCRGSSQIPALKNRVGTMPMFRPDTLVFFRVKRRQGSNPVLYIKLASKNYLCSHDQPRWEALAFKLLGHPIPDAPPASWQTLLTQQWVQFFSRAMVKIGAWLPSSPKSYNPVWHATVPLTASCLPLTLPALKPVLPSMTAFFVPCYMDISV